jgi:hypothetical protein
MAAEFGALENLELRHSGFSDADSPILRSHPNLKKLGMASNPGITDQSLQAIANANSLEELDLTATGVTDQGLANLARLPRVQQLFLNSTGEFGEYSTQSASHAVAPRSGKKVSAVKLRSIRPKCPQGFRAKKLRDSWGRGLACANEMCTIVSNRASEKLARVFDNSDRGCAELRGNCALEGGR